MIHSTSSHFHFFRVGGNEVHVISHFISRPNRSGNGFFLKTVLSAGQTPISRCSCERGVRKLVLRVGTEQPALEQKCHCKGETSQRYYFYPFHLLQKGQRQHPLRLCRGKRRCSLPVSVWHVAGMEGKRKIRTSALAMSTLPLSAGLCFADKKHCSIPVQPDCARGTRVHVARSGLSPFFFS